MAKYLSLENPPDRARSVWMLRTQPLRLRKMRWAKESQGCPTERMSDADEHPLIKASSEAFKWASSKAVYDRNKD
jgi:hypothetical protein